MPISKEKKTSILINMDKELKSKLEELASKEGRSTTNYINYILQKHIDNLAKNLS